MYPVIHLAGLPANILNVLNWDDVSNILQFFVIFIVVFLLYVKVLHGTYVAQLLKGIGVVLLLNLIANVFNLTIISSVLQAIIQISIIGFIILFQPELRRLLVYIGQPDFFSRSSFLAGGKEKDAEQMLHELVESIRLLSKTKTGALIVLESAMGSGGSYLEAGTKLDARLSTELLLTIFHPNTPLHDGAVVISHDNKVLAAGVLLPLSENPNLTWKYGTRHRAAIGLSEVSDCRCIVVSEETGNLSVAYHGTIEKMASIDDLRQHLVDALGITDMEGPSSKRASFPGILSGDLLQKFFTRYKKESEVATVGDERSPL